MDQKEKLEWRLSHSRTWRADLEKRIEREPDDMRLRKALHDLEAEIEKMVQRLGIIRIAKRN